MMKLSYLALSVVGMSSFGLVGCGQGGASFSTLPSAQSFKQGSLVANNKIDILWMVDNSGSMQPLQQNMASNFDSFIGDINTKGYDFHIAVSTSEAYKADPTLNGYSSTNASLAKFRDGTDATSHTGIFDILPTTANLINTFVINGVEGSNGSGDEREFSSMKTALNSSMNKGFLRADSFLAVIILSDEDDFSGAGRAEYGGTDHNYSASTLDSVQSYISYLDTLTGSTGSTRRYNVSSIAVLDTACYNSHYNASPSTIVGQRYISLSAATSGVTGSICDASYASSLTAIQKQIEELSTQFYLSSRPVVNSIIIQVNSVTEPNDATNGWTYNSSANSIVFHGTAIPPQNANINVSFIPQNLTAN